MGRLRRLWARFPRAGLALRTAVAAGVAWFVAHLIPGPVAEFTYYAPLGAVVATSFTIARSARDSVRAVSAIIIGGAVATAADVWLTTSPIAVAAVVFVGSLLGGWRALGEHGVLAPTAALFVLVIGSNEQPIVFIASYAGLVLLGAAVGVVVTLCFPQMPLAPAQLASAKLRAMLADQMTSLADGLEKADLPAAEEWHRRRLALEPTLWRMRDEVHQMADAWHANVRARRHRPAIELQQRQAQALDRIVEMVDDLASLVTEEEQAENSVAGLGPELRPAVAQSLRELATLLETVDGQDTDWAAADRTEAALTSLADTIRARQSATPDDGLFVAGAIVTSMRRILRTIAPVEQKPSNS